MMKKLSIMMSILLPFGMLCACSSDDEFDYVSDKTVSLIGDSGLPKDSMLSQNQAWQIVKTFVLNNQLDKIDVYVSKSTIQPNKTIETISTPDKSPDYESWLFFIDDIPYANWSHPCRYVYVNTVGGKYEVHQHSMPPKSMGEFILLVQMPPETWDESKYAIPVY